MSRLQDLTPAVMRARVLVGLLYMGAVACVMVGSALLSSMGGELPVYDPTAAERSQWAWGQGLGLAGAALTLLCVALVFALRRRLGLSLGAAARVALGVILLSGLLYFLTWVVVAA